MPSLVLVSVSASLPPINLCPCQMKMNVIWESSGCYRGMCRNRVISGCFGDDLQPGFIDILCLIRQFHVKNGSFTMPSNMVIFPHHGPGDPKLNWQNLGWTLDPVGTIWISGCAEEIPISFSCSWAAQVMTAFGCCCLHIGLQYFVHGSYLNLLPMAVLFLITVSPSLLNSLAVAFQRRSSK